MIRSQTKDISVVTDGLSLTSDIKVLSGNPAQTYNKDKGEFEPDRSLVPCLLMPYVEVSDPNGVMNGSQTITSCQWFEGSPKADASNLIASSGDYVIGKSGNPAFSLSVEKNTDPDIPMDIHAVYTFVDKRKNTEVKIERQISFYTAVYESNNYNVSVDCPDTWRIDPTRVKADASGRWLHTIKAQLNRGPEAVDDANAAYWWEVSEDGVNFRDFTLDELNHIVSGRSESGRWGRVLTFDARMIRNMTVRVRASFYDGIYPDAPILDNVQRTVTVKVAMPKTLKYQIVQTSGAKVSSTLGETVKFAIRFSDNKGDLDLSSLAKVDWYAKSGKSGTAAKLLGTGMNLSFVPSSLGFDKSYSMAVYANIYLYTVHALVTFGGKAVVQSGNYVTYKKFE